MIKIDIDSEPLIQEIEDYIRKEIPDERRDYVLDLIKRALQSTIRFNPVDTARSRASWVSGLEQLGGEASAGWEGPHPVAAAISEGRAAGEREEESGQHHDEFSVTSHVEYINYLEFGTSKLAPRGMVRQALHEAAASVRANGQ